MTGKIVIALEGPIALMKTEIKSIDKHITYKFKSLNKFKFKYSLLCLGVLLFHIAIHFKIYLCTFSYWISFLKRKQCM